MDTKTIARFIVLEMSGVVLIGVALFWSAGRIDWWAAWALVALTAAWVGATAIVILRSDPSLLAERMGAGRGGALWDTVIMSTVGLLELARLIVAGLDRRYGWTGSFPTVVQGVAAAVSALGYALVVWATASNPFFSQIMRIQTERGHTVAAGGPYQFLRHPAYIGTILYQLAVPILLDSQWALIPGSLNVVLVVLRTGLEDRALRNELAGYGEYAHDVRYRLLPYVW